MYPIFFIISQSLYGVIKYTTLYCFTQNLENNWLFEDVGNDKTKFY